MAAKIGYKNIFRDPLGFPEWQGKGLPVEGAPPELAAVSLEPEAPGPLYGWAMLWTLGAIFLGGVALNLTPCVYPLIPITVSCFGGRSGQARGRLAIHASLYVGGLCLTNSLLGVAAALTGGLMGAMLQSPYVLVAVAAILAFFATSLFGFWELRLPSGLTQMAAKSCAGYSGSLFMGLTLGVVAAPCLGPFVLGLLTWVASLGSPWLGFLIFFTLSLGLGLPLFFLAVFSGSLEKLPRSGEWLLWVRSLMGWVLLGMAAYFVRPVFPGPLGTILLAVVALVAGIHLGWLDRTKAHFRAFRWLKAGVALVSLVTAVLLLGHWLLRSPGMAWQPYSDELLAEAQVLKKPVIIDFYATWCAPCREMEETTFHNPQVVEMAARDFLTLRVDVTRAANPLNERLIHQFGVKGVPTVIFLDRQGKELADLRLVGYLPPEQFRQRLAQVK